jgi:hypothetical protein
VVAFSTDHGHINVWSHKGPYGTFRGVLAHVFQNYGSKLENGSFVGFAFVFGGRKGRDFREILGERVGGTHFFLAREREEMV